MLSDKITNIENRQYREYLYTPDETLTLNGCCQSYPLDRDYWNNQLLSRNFLIDYGFTQHIKYPISEGICVGDASVPRTCLPKIPNLKSSCSSGNSPNPIWTIEEEGLVDNVNCQAEQFNKQINYWSINDSRGSCPSHGLPLIPQTVSNIGQPLRNSVTGALDKDCALSQVERKRVTNQCCPNLPNLGRVQTPRSKEDLIFFNNRSPLNNLNNPGLVGNHRNVDAESALMGIDYWNNVDIYQNKICSDPLQGTKSNLYAEFFQDNNCIFPNFTPKFWDNLTRAKSGSQLVTAKGYSKKAMFC